MIPREANLLQKCRKLVTVDELKKNEINEAVQSKERFEMRGNPVEKKERRRVMLENGMKRFMDLGE